LLSKQALTALRPILRRGHAFKTGRASTPGRLGAPPVAEETKGGANAWRYRAPYGGESNLKTQPSPGRVPTLHVVVPYILALAYFVLLTGAAWRLHARFLTHALDLGYFDQIVWNIAYGQPFANTLKYPWNFMGDHLSPILVFLAPLYWLWRDVRGLLTVQSLALALAGLPLYWLACGENPSSEDGKSAHRRLGARWAAVILLAFYLNPALHLINLSDFHEIALVTPLVSLAVYALERRRYRLMTAALFFSLLCKEDVAILTLAFGVYLLFEARTRGWGAVIALFSLAWLIMAVQIVIPAFREEGDYGAIGARYGYLGASVGEALRTLVTRPGLALAHLARWEILTAFLRQLLPTGFLALLGWPVFALTLPVFLYLQLSEEPSLYTLQEWHVAPLLPLIFAAAIRGLGYLRGRWRTIGVAALCLGSLYAFVQYSPLPYALTVSGTPPQRAARIEAIIAHLSPEAVVSAQSDIVPHVSQRKEVYVFPSVIGAADDIILDRQGNTYPVSENYHHIVDEEVLPRPDFRPYYQANDLIWLHKEDLPPTETPLATFGQGSIRLLDAQLAIGDKEGFFKERLAPSFRATEAVPLMLQPGQYLQLSLLWEGLQGVESRYTALVQLVDKDSGSIIVQHEGAPASGVTPKYSWTPTGVLRDTHYLVFEGEAFSGTAELIVRLYDSATREQLVTDDGLDHLTCQGT